MYLLLCQTKKWRLELTLWNWIVFKAKSWDLIKNPNFGIPSTPPPPPPPPFPHVIWRKKPENLTKPQDSIRISLSLSLSLSVVLNAVERRLVLVLRSNVARYFSDRGLHEYSRLFPTIQCCRPDSTHLQSSHVRGHRKSSQKPSETTKFVWGRRGEGGGGVDKITLKGLKLMVFCISSDECAAHSSESWSLKCKLLFVSGVGREFRVKLCLCVSLGVCEILWWPLEKQSSQNWFLTKNSSNILGWYGCEKKGVMHTPVALPKWFQLACQQSCRSQQRKFILSMINPSQN